ncbi:hypothetical protein [Rhodospirillum sp. A1_3_36]|uniref:hypothetical protein n=1 Tax=Rhodospirillum sp. A1_3_36 TaxID=3391666 RepID=UPI0039A62117
MARTSLKGRRLRAVALVCALIVAPGVAWATYPVIDVKALAEAARQLNALKEQILLIKKEIENTTQILTVLKDVSNLVQEQIDAIGELGEIPVPVLNVIKMTRQLQRDAMCLKPNLEALMPSLDMDDINLASICSARTAYADTLWFDPAKAKEMTWEEQDAARREVLKRRQRVLRTAAVDGLAQAAVQTAATADQADQAVGELERHAKAAKNVNSRLAVLNQTLLLIARQYATQTQLLASTLRIQAAQATMSTVDQDPMNPDGETPDVPGTSGEAPQ